MADKTSTDQYGRKKWDVDAYEADAKSGKKTTTTQPSDEAWARKLQKQNFLEHRADLLDQAIDSVGKHTLIGSENATSLTYGKNKRFGFSCPTCDLSFRDTLALVDHFNSPQHLHNVRKVQGGDLGMGEELENGVKRASVDQVIATIEDLVKKLLREKAADSNGHVALSFQERVRRRLEFEQQKSSRRLAKKKRARATAAGEVEQTEMGKLMGFEGFGSTKAG
ncbi:hypothetical protein METBIDRAFT_77882 [Metschnikowia bicuspidata var. bicuspidata NRRL YB-4993]|uniref:C2H2-type domain-containing protein n=1 Tax=Metschnikowia bicuspidata var. bicuspidata NRRL YB-4993 TaxID=869754 RepID=A0A1A0HEG5_9ASCO|nr:hypothetical protein METBIDRAFT_77882 [Metschnikowia bicuspidata var. bicuspidata NRRL YB-4993]OBA22504.1 hypothetical protein METBIDRAFT_77882 [Metschnikowia bicuspidata var. bicuspidata NRRL YB-4993]